MGKAMSKLVLITGASSGLGQALAWQVMHWRWWLAVQRKLPQQGRVDQLLRVFSW